MKQRPAILFVTEKFPWPLNDGGQIRTYRVLKGLSAHFRITILSLFPPCLTDIEPIRELGANVITVPHKKKLSRTPWYLTQSVFGRRPHPLPKNFSRQILVNLQREIGSGGFRAAHFNHLDAVQYIDYLAGPARNVNFVSDTHNLLTPMYARLEKESENSLRKLYCLLQRRKMRLYERATLGKSDCVLVCSEVERQVLQSWGIDHGLVIRNGVDTAYFTPGPRKRQPACSTNRQQQIVFTGALDYFPNEHGVRWFVDSVLPELRRLLPLCKVTIVGKNPPRRLKRLEVGGSIEFTGFVEDVRPYARSADVFIVPLRIGAGTRLKILEALSMELPVVSTSIGAEGLELREGQHLRIADDPASFAHAIGDLCVDVQEASRLARNGRGEVLRRYDWDKVVSPLIEYYERTL